MCCGFFSKNTFLFLSKNGLTFFWSNKLFFIKKIFFKKYQNFIKKTTFCNVSVPLLANSQLFNYKKNQNFSFCKLFELKMDLYHKILDIFLIFSHSFSAVWTSGREWCMWSNLFPNAVHAHACADFGSYAAVGCQVARWILTSSCQWFVATLSESTTRTGHHTSGLVGRRNRYVGGFGGAALSQKITICMHLD